MHNVIPYNENIKGRIGGNSLYNHYFIEFFLQSVNIKKKIYYLCLLKTNV